MGSEGAYIGEPKKVKKDPNAPKQCHRFQHCSFAALRSSRSARQAIQPIQLAAAGPSPHPLTAATWTSAPAGTPAAKSTSPRLSPQTCLLLRSLTSSAMAAQTAVSFCRKTQRVLLALQTSPVEKVSPRCCSTKEQPITPRMA